MKQYNILNITIHKYEGTSKHKAICKSFILRIVTWSYNYLQMTIVIEKNKDSYLKLFCLFIKYWLPLRKIS